MTDKRNGFRVHRPTPQPEEYFVWIKSPDTSGAKFEIISDMNSKTEGFRPKSVHTYKGKGEWDVFKYATQEDTNEMLRKVFGKK